MNKLVSLNQVIADLRDEMGDSFTDNRPMVNRMLRRELKKVIGRAYLTPCISVHVIDGCNLVLPDCAMLFEGAIWGDHGCDCFALFKDFQFKNYKGSAGLNIGAYEDGRCGIAMYHAIASDGTIQFSRNLNGQPITVKTWGWKKDECGTIMVPEKLIDYCIAVITYKVAKRKVQSKSKNSGDFAWYKEAMRLLDLRFRQAMAMSEVIYDHERLELVNMVNDPLSGNPFPDNSLITFQSNLLEI